MPHPSVRNQNQDVILWAKVGDDWQGEPEVSSPVVIKCRWDDRKSQAVNADGTVIGLDATVYVSQDIAIDSLMKLGILTDLTGTGFDEVNPDVYQVKTITKTPNLNNRANTRRLGLVRFRGSLPAGVG